MFVISQDKHISINMKKILSIYNRNKVIGVEYPFNEEAYVDLGRYETQKRADEIFDEIMKRYKSWENMKAGQPSGTCNPIYKMPLE